LSITGFPITGTNAADFSATSTTCSAPVAPAGTCTISVTFAPQTTIGAKTAILTINSNAAGAGKTVTLTGTATADITRPTLTATTPAAGATSLTAASLAGASVPGITATFSEPIAPATIVTTGAAPTVTLRVGATVIGINASLDPTGKVLKISPTAALADDTTYVVRLTNGIRDLANNTLAATNWSFTTGPAPTVTARTPANGATLVAPFANITATFSEPMVAAAITAAGNVTVAPTAGGAPVAATVTYQAGTIRTVTIDPTANLAANTSYTVTLVGGVTAIRDQAGNPLVPTPWTFTTGTSPTVTATAPTAGQTGVPRNTNVTATFNVAMNAATLTGATVTLRRGTAAGGALQAAALTYDATTRTVTLDPSVNLVANTVYTVRLLTGITDSAGNPLEPVTFSFTTGAV
jgi:hypothetical protein